MKDIDYLFWKIVWRFGHVNRERVNDFFRRGGKDRKEL